MSDDAFDYDVAVVGGGPAGLTAALYATRLGHDTLVVDRGGGRAAMMRDTHNVIGVPEDVSGAEFLETAREQVRGYGVDYRRSYVEDVAPVGESVDDGFRVETDGDETFRVRRVVLATGFTDARPDPPLPPTGRGLHWCLHCDAYMFVDEPVFVMGSGESAARVATILLNVTDEVDLLTRGDEPTWSEETAELLANHPVDVVAREVTGVERDESGWLASLEFEDGEVRPYRGGFPMYGADYHADLADGLGVERADDGAVVVDDRGRTSVEGVYAAGDLTPGHSQIPVAMGEGADAGIAIHEELRAFPRSLDEVEATGPVTDDEVPAISPALRETALAHGGHAGGPRESGSESAAGAADDGERPAED